MQSNPTIRNIAIIAHVDHGKTTLVDAMIHQSGLMRRGDKVSERLLDNMDLERERGITIAAKNCAITWKNIKINIIDTPGHADFGGEVERALSMADGALLLVDASEGPLPQTRFVLEKALSAKLPVIVAINKIDRQDARPKQVLDEIYDLFIDLEAGEDQLDFPYLYAVGRDGIAKTELESEGQNLHPLLDMILKHIPAPVHDPGAPFQMLVSDLGYSDFLGRLAVGKVANGQIKNNDSLVCISENNTRIPLKVSQLQTYESVSLVQVKSAEPGDIIVLSGIENVRIGDTICTQAHPRALKRIRVDEPTVAMRFTINSSPLAGREGEYVQSRKIRDRLLKETLRNVAIEVEQTDNRELFIVKGRGEFQMAILLETMRREGFELSVGRPEVIYKYKNGQKLEPLEELFVDCDEPFIGVVTEKLSGRKGRLTQMTNHGSGRVRMSFSVPSRALIGYRDEFLTDTKGTGIMNSRFAGYEPFRGDFSNRFTGSIISDRQGVAVAYALFNLEPRGQLFIRPGQPVYKGMVFGEHNRSLDITANPCKEKKLTNIRASGRDENIILAPVKPMTLERALNFIREDELVEVTPASIRLRKALLDENDRKRAEKRKT
ncbi:MAG: translational GTPase TypA [Desulfobacteraceae bacterium]|nr:translational GTPase TypA [Desulfobacteraceae bacterium]